MKNDIVKKKLVVDITDLPDKIRDTLYEKYSGRSNGSYINFYVHDEQKPMSEHIGKDILFVDKTCGDEHYIVERGDDPISDYFYDIGLNKRQKIVIHYWW